MNSKILIQDHAKNFALNIKSYESEHNGPQNFKDDLRNELYNYYESHDKLIYLYEVVKHIDSLYAKHLEKCKYKENPEKCTVNKYYLNCKFFTEQEIKELKPSIENNILLPNINIDLLKLNLVELKDFPEAGKLFQSALDKLNESKYERNLLDDLRLCLESILKTILNNNKSLENQKEHLGSFLKQFSTSKELANMFGTLISFYINYQNTYIKHNDNVKREEIELMINLTSAFIYFLIKLK